MKLLIKSTKKFKTGNCYCKINTFLTDMELYTWMFEISINKWLYGYLYCKVNNDSSSSSFVMNETGRGHPVDAYNLKWRRAGARVPTYASCKIFKIHTRVFTGAGELVCRNVGEVYYILDVSRPHGKGIWRRGKDRQKK